MDVHDKTGRLIAILDGLMNQDSVARSGFHLTWVSGDPSGWVVRVPGVFSGPDGPVVKPDAASALREAIRAVVAAYRGSAARATREVEAYEVAIRVATEGLSEVPE